VSTNKKVVAYQ